MPCRILDAAFWKEEFMTYSLFEESQEYHDSVAGRIVKEKSAQFNQKQTMSCKHSGCHSHVTHPCEGCGHQWYNDKHAQVME